MNKYKEALEFIINATNGGEGIIKELNILRELVDKEQAQEIGKVEEFWSHETEYGLEFICPNCEETLESYEGVYDYCPRCGQRIVKKGY